MKNLIYSLFVVLCLLGQVGYAAGERVNVNTADSAELAEVLNGVGAARAEAIVKHREEFGDFASLEDLLAVRGVGQSVIETNRERITFSE
jgi:competence protein ComEA